MLYTHSPLLIFLMAANTLAKVGLLSTSSSQHFRIKSNTGRPISVVMGNVGRNGMLSPFRTRFTASMENNHTGFILILNNVAWTKFEKYVLKYEFEHNRTSSLKNRPKRTSSLENQPLPTRKCTTLVPQKYTIYRIRTIIYHHLPWMWYICGKHRYILHQVIEIYGKHIASIW